MARSSRSARVDQLTAAWDRLALAGRTGPLDERTCRLLELAIALGTGQREAIRATHARLAELAVSADELEQLLALAAAAIGKHTTLAAYGWMGLVEPAGAAAPTSAPPPDDKPGA